MWWSESRVVLAALVMASMIGLGACGFEPVYGRGNTTRHAELAAVEVAPIQGRAGPGAISDGSDRLKRAGRELRNRLITTLGAERTEPRYRLGITLEEQQGEFAIQANDTVTRYKLALTANFNLIDLATDESIHSGSTRSIGSYNVVSSEFATVASEQDTRRRAALDLADNIRELLIIYFSREESEAQSTP